MKRACETSIVLAPLKALFDIASSPERERGLELSPSKRTRAAILNLSLSLSLSP